jgi:hypothetical protein
MTYNFDPDRWYENERMVIERRYKMDEMSDREYADAIADLERRYNEMLDRLNGAYQLPE